VVEAAGIPTVTLNMIWPFHRMVGMPRIAAIEHPFGRPYGDVGDAKTQAKVMRAALEVFGKAEAPGHIEHMPFRWHEHPKETKWHPPEPAPLMALMKSRRK